MSICLLLLFLLACVAFPYTEATLYAGGAGNALYFYNTTTVAGIGSQGIVDGVSYGQIVTQWPPSTFTIEFWAKTNFFPFVSQNPHYFSLAVLHSFNFEGVDDGADDDYINVQNGYASLLSNTAGAILSATNWTDLRLGEWQHMALTLDVTTGVAHFYLNGDLEYSDENTETQDYLVGANLTSTVALVLGQDQDAFYGSFQDLKAFVGVMDEVRIWNVVRTQEEIQADMHHVLPGSTAGLFAKWGMDILESDSKTILNEVDATANPLVLGGQNAFADVVECPAGRIGVSDNVECNRRPSWIPSDAPLTGSRRVRAFIPSASLSSVKLPGSSDVPNAQITTSIQSLQTCSTAAGWSIYLDSVTPAVDGSVIPGNSDTIWVSSTAAVDASCTFTYQISDGTSAPTSATVTLIVAKSLTARNVHVDVVAGAANIFIPLTARPFAQGPFKGAIVQTLPIRGSIYRATLIWNDVPQRKELLSVGDVVNTEVDGIQYVPHPNEHGAPFDTFEFSVVGEHGIVSTNNAVATINLAARTGIPAVAGVNTFYLTFANRHHIDFPNYPLLGMAEFTMEMWLWPDPVSSSTAARIWATADDTLVLTMDQVHNVLRFAVAGQPLLRANITSQQWSHVAVSKDSSGEISIYVNNNVQDVHVSTAGIPSSGTGLVIGKGYEGGLDEIAIFNSSKGVVGGSRNLNVLLRPQETANLSVVWHLNEGSKGIAACGAPVSASTTEASLCGPAGSYAGQLGGGSASRFPLWTAAPKQPSNIGWDGFPFLSTYISEENASSIIIQLNAITQDSDERLLVCTINSLPTLGKLYQYNETNPPNYIGEAITEYFTPWRISQPRKKQWVSRVPQYPNRTIPWPSDPTLRFSTQYYWTDEYSGYGVNALLGAPEKYDASRADLGYGGSEDSWCPSTPRGVKCEPKGPANPWGWNCPPSPNAMEFVEVGYDLATHIVSINSYENLNPGTTEIISVRHPATNDWIAVWKGAAQKDLYSSRGTYISQTYLMNSPGVCGTPFQTDAIRLDRANYKLDGWKEIDAIENVGTDRLEAGYVTDMQYRVVYVPDPSKSGVDGFDYGATDCIGDLSQLSETSTVTIHLTSLVHPATAPEGMAMSYPVSRLNGGTGDVLPFTVMLEAYERDERTPKFQITKPPGIGYLTNAAGERISNAELLSATSNTSSHIYRLDLTFHPTGCGIDTLSYQVIDDLRTSDPIAIQVVIPCVPYTAYSAPLGIFVAFLSSVGLLGILAAAVFTRIYVKRKVIKAASPIFLGLILLGLALTFISNLFYAGPVTRASCIVAPALLAIGFSLSLGSLCIKNLRIYYIFNNPRPSKKALKDMRLLQATVPLVLINVIMIAVWGAASPPIPVMMNPESTDHYLVCQSANNTWSTMLMAYNGFILGVTVLFAFVNRNVALQYNESKQLGIASYNVIVFCLLGFPVVFMPGTTPSLVFMVRAIAIWSASFVILTVTFAPKAWLILRKGESDLKPSNGLGLKAGIRATARVDDSRQSSITSQTVSNHAQEGLANVVQHQMMARFKPKLMFGPWRDVHVICLPAHHTVIYVYPDCSALSCNWREDTFKFELDPVREKKQVLRIIAGGKIGTIEMQLSEADATNWSALLTQLQQKDVEKSCRSVNAGGRGRDLSVVGTSAGRRPTLPPTAERKGESGSDDKKGSAIPGPGPLDV
ncbi:7 transmembrane sweet-taste receptor of 3 GCPR-domain-containing protein [Fimicolochytrium jonesii]|uniref:7 transmembrane sweet-taste receptor of 3 GCPR-domain-containing protein n=1 Tax=Fimicolochytrium jonesii TaxID=1396493 RepID=UPI0022FEE495|nr:7 transmembrane sweet-taste receptor of 3 GCPR-domain-containing protein [Fimicolochytrium jonesii]KAI8824548.1 7 transmembrane sweet-taste receptor of 3 GCPR-domain-containing protein [Fimicolochytrium jonesii]